MDDETGHVELVQARAALPVELRLSGAGFSVRDPGCWGNTLFDQSVLMGDQRAPKARQDGAAPRCVADARFKARATSRRSWSRPPPAQRMLAAKALQPAALLSKSAPMQFITEQEFLATIERLQAQYPRVRHWSKNRWVYHAAAIEILREQLPAGVRKVLEIGPTGVQLVPGSDVLDYKVRRANWPVSDPKYLHDATKFPWPIGDKAYDLLIALRVFQHLVPVQRQAFHEARRVATNLLLVVPEEYVKTPIGSQGISHQAFVEWNDGVQPTAFVRTNHGDAYFWNELALQKNSMERQT